MRPPTCILHACLAVVLLSTVPGCRQKNEASLPAGTVATIGRQTITREAFERELARRVPPVPSRNNDTEIKLRVLDDLVRFEVLYEKALTAGYDRDPQVQAELKRMIVVRFQQDNASPPGQVTTEEIAEYYRTHQDRFGHAERVRAAIIQLKIPRTAVAEKRAEVRARAERIRAEAKSNAGLDKTFGLLAQMHSEDQSTRYRGGDLGWLIPRQTNSTYDLALLSGISRLKEPGEIGPVIETPDCFYLVKLVDREAATGRPLSEVRDGVQYLLVREKEREHQDRLYSSLREGVPIRTNRSLLNSIPLPAAKPPANLPTTRTDQASNAGTH